MLQTTSFANQNFRNGMLSLWRHPFRPLWTWCLLFALLIGIEELGHDHVKTLQMLALALPFQLVLLLPIANPRYFTARTVLVCVVLASFLFDSILRYFIYQAYQAAPESSLVLSAVANTTPQESIEFIASFTKPIITLLALGLLTLGLLIILVKAASASAIRPYPTQFRSKGIFPFLIIAIAISTLAYASKPWRKLHPLSFWPRTATNAIELRESWHDLGKKRLQEFNFAQTLKPTITHEESSTLVLVISDSLNRDNMSTHGYARNTTPRLAALSQSLRQDMINFRYAWSTQAATLASLDSLFNLATKEGQTVHLLALAKAAGYHISWIGNHDGQAIEQAHARFADHLVMLNKIPGRDSTSSDSSTHQPLAAALQQPHQRKLVVVHMLGAHPQYKMRYPNSAAIYTNANDGVTQAMKKQGRSKWLIEKRNEYDAALRHHDDQIVKTFEITREALHTTKHGTWIFVSDHGQEVGHTREHAGHSASTAAGYRIPSFIWSKQALAPSAPNIANRPFRLDWLGWTILSQLAIEWTEQQTHKDILREEYRFENPQLGIPIKSFSK
ncbi:sulfatase-like hydrolase/transferase [Undibacterium seohonense]|uniref:Sulfatase-like hydrolase/transferase n=1 Tax=Undibacterium seohonense TaxID=1344950 RepID=A0ABR6X8T6_9BURK|nr:sulfatase-like hydrolase/transferase [Undibacterium seohonense]